MANVKKIIAHAETGADVYCIVERDADGYLLNNADGSFASGPADPYLDLAEDGTIKGRYVVSESRDVWDDGKYNVTAYKSLAGAGSENPTNDTVEGSGIMAIVDDLEVAIEDIPSLTLDEPLTGATHDVENSLARRTRNLQEFGTYENGNVYVNTIGGVAGTTDYESGTNLNPVDSIADANTVGTSLNLAGRHIVPLSSITLAASQDGNTFCGDNWTLALGGQSVSGTHFRGASVSGICSGANTPEFHECIIGNITIPPSTFKDCELGGAITLPVGKVHLHDCAGESGLILDYGAAIANTIVHVTNFSGDLVIDNLGQSGTDILDIRGHGKIILNASCVGGTINWDGHFTIENNGSGITINADDITTVAVAMAAKVDRIIGLTLENHVEDDIVRDGDGNKTSCVIYCYDTAASATTHDKVTGLTASYTMAATYSVGRMSLFKVTKD